MADRRGLHTLIAPVALFSLDRQFPASASGISVLNQTSRDRDCSRSLDCFTIQQRYRSLIGTTRRLATDSTMATTEHAANALPAIPPITAAQVAARKAVPNTFATSLSTWWSTNGDMGRDAEERLLRRLPFSVTYHAVPEVARDRSSNTDSAASSSSSLVGPSTDKDGLRATVYPRSFADQPDKPASTGFLASWTGSSQSHRDKEKYLNTIKISNDQTETSRDAVVMLHGYGAGSGFYFRNFEQVARASVNTARRMYSLDWLGMGRSGRPDPSELAPRKNAGLDERVTNAEGFFVESLEAWRVKEGVDRMMLIGHSLGGYLSTAYALKYPSRVSSLVLLSPAGIPHNPHEPAPKSPSRPVSRQLSRPSSPTGLHEPGLDQAAAAAQREFLEPQDVTTGDAEHGKRVAEEKAKIQSRSGRQGTMAKFFVYGWEKGWSPFALLRTLGPWGPMFVGKYATRRFASLPEEELRDMNAYLWGITSAKGSGEYCITHLLAPGAFARRPIVDRISALKVPVTFVYGDSDWMDPAGGKLSVARLKEAGNTNGRVFIVKNAGHHVYLDNPHATNRIMRDAIFADAQGKGL